MKITPELINHLEALGKLKLTDEEKVSCEKELQDIISYMETLGELDTSGTEPLSHSFPVTNVFSPEAEPSSRERELILQNAPESCGGCFKVPKTVE